MMDDNDSYNPLEHSRRLGQTAQSNLVKYERIWRSVEALRDSHVKTLEGVDQLTLAIRNLIDRIPPENLR